MKYVTRRDFLLKELISIIDQSELCLEKIEKKATSRSNSFFIKKCQRLQKILNDMRLEIQINHSGHTLTKENIKHFLQKLLTEQSRSYQTINELSEFCMADVISEDHPFCAQLTTTLIYVMRAILGLADWFFSSANPSFRENQREHPFSDDYVHAKSYDQQGETPFALRLTGHSQFVPHPIHCLNDAQKALKNISERIELVYCGMERESRLASL